MSCGDIMTFKKLLSIVVASHEFDKMPRITISIVSNQNEPYCIKAPIEKFMDERLNFLKEIEVKQCWMPIFSKDKYDYWVMMDCDVDDILRKEGWNL